MAKKKTKNKDIYCVFCGTKNSINDEKCSKCKKSLHPKNTLFKDFLYEHIRDDLKDKLEDNIFSYIKNFIISHLYGSLMFVSVVFTVVTVITTNIKPYKTISKMEDMLSKGNSNEVVVRVYTYDDTCSNDYDQALVDVPFAVAGVPSGLRRTIYEVNIKKGMTINEWCNDNELICKEELSLYDKKIETDANIYRKKVLEYADWIKSTGDIGSDEYADRNFELMDLSDKIMPYENIDVYDKNKKITSSIDLFVSMVGCAYEE